MITRAEFENVQARYEEGRQRLSTINTGDLIWEKVDRGFDADYHAAVVRQVHIDNASVEVVDVTQGNRVRVYASGDFLTASELLEAGIATQHTIDEDRREYMGIIEKVKRGDI